MRITQLIAGAALAAVLAACAPQQPAAESVATEAAAEAPLALKAPAGVYTLDKNHASLIFAAPHLGLSNYTARFQQFDATLNFDPANPSAITVEATVNPASVDTDYTGDYRATHPQSKFKTWEEDLAKGWFRADQHPQITFKSTAVEVTGARTAKVTGDLTFNGVTAPVTLDATFNGELVPHPFLNGRSAVGFSATGSLSRAAFGVDNLPQAIGDLVTFTVEAEFHQQATS